MKGYQKPQKITVKLKLDLSKPKKDGSFPVVVYCYDQVTKKEIRTGWAFRKNEWDPIKQEVKFARDNHGKINFQLQRIRNDIEGILLDGCSIADLGKEKSKPKEDLLSFFEDYYQELLKGLEGLRKGTLKTYLTTLKHLRNFKEDSEISLNFDSIGQGFESKFKLHLQKTCNQVTIGKHIKNLKKVLGVALTRGLHENKSFQKFKVEKLVKTEHPILTEDELSQIVNLDLSHSPSMEKERDRFYLSVLWMLRFNESRMISRTLIYEKNGKKYIRIPRSKNGNDSSHSISEIELEILEKWNFDFSKTPNQVANRRLKKICRMAGIIQSFSDGLIIGPKCDFISTHTARRTGATLYHSKGVPLKVIQNIGGWKNIGQVQVYLKIGKEEAADLAIKILGHRND